MSKTSAGNTKVASFTGKNIAPGEHTYYLDTDGNERRANHGAALPVEAVGNLDHLVDRGIVVVKTVPGSTENAPK